MTESIRDRGHKTAGRRLRCERGRQASMLGAFALGTVVMAALTALVINATGSEGLFLGLVLCLMIGIAILMAAGLEAWLPVLFAVGLLATLNFTVERFPLTVYGFDPLLIALYVGWIWRAYRGEARPLRWQSIDSLSLALLAWCLLASLLGTRVPVALNGWLLYVRGFMIYLYFAHALQQRWQVSALLTVLIAMLALQGGLGLLQYMTRSNIGSISDLVGGTVSKVREVETIGGGGLFRVRGTLNTDTSLSHWLDMLVPLALSVGLAERRIGRRLILAGVALFGLASQVVTFTRGGWFGVAAGVVVALYLHFRGRLLRRRNLITAAALLLSVALLLLPFAGAIHARLFESEQDTLAVRENLNRTALEIISDYPLTGIGLDNFVYVAPAYGTGWTWETEGKAHKVHNVYLALATEVGPLGLLLFLAVLGVALLRAWSMGKTRTDTGSSGDDPLARGLTAGLAAVLVHGLAAWGLLSYGVFPLFWLFVGTAARDPALDS